MRIKKLRIAMDIVKAGDLPLEQLPVSGDLLLVLEFWDGGAKEGCLFVEKKTTEYILWEYIYPYFTHEGDASRQNLQSTADAQSAIKEIENFCNRQYLGIEPLDLTEALQKKAVCEFFSL